ncbi:MAG: DUF2062 domain-containing protein [Syntrophomonadaceae bacterium]|nr:DUF2062 domain-containing protein [Syntrophomonadaceae bacterium]
MGAIKRWLKELAGSYRKLLMSPDSSNRIAHGIALGLGLDFLPIPLISIPFSYLLARVLGVNAPAAVLTAVIFKWAVPFFFAFNFYTGSLLVGRLPELTFSSHLPWYQLGWLMVRSIGYPFLIGSLTNAALAWSAAYFILRRLLQLYRRRLAS